MSTPPLELQPSLVQKFIKNHLEEDLLISSNFKKVFSRCLTSFIFYLMTISNCSSRERNKSTVTIDDLRKSLEEMDFEEEILKKINNTVLEYKSKSKKKIKSEKKEQIEIEEEVNIESEPENEVLSEKNDEMEEEKHDDENGGKEGDKEDVVGEKNDDKIIDEGIEILEENNE